MADNISKLLTDGCYLKWRKKCPFLVCSRRFYSREHKQGLSWPPLTLILSIKCSITILRKKSIHFFIIKSSDFVKINQVSGKKSVAVNKQPVWIASSVTLSFGSCFDPLFSFSHKKLYVRKTDPEKS